MACCEILVDVRDRGHYPWQSEHFTRGALYKPATLRLLHIIFHHPSSIIRHPLSIIHHLFSIMHYPLSIVHYPSSIVRYPLSTVHHPPSVILHSSSSTVPRIRHSIIALCVLSLLISNTLVHTLGRTTQGSSEQQAAAATLNCMFSRLGYRGHVCSLRSRPWQAFLSGRG